MVLTPITPLGQRPISMAPHPTAAFTKSAIASFDFEGQNENELSFRTGDVLQLKEKPVNADWWEAHLGGRFGMVPICYLDLGNTQETQVISSVHVSTCTDLPAARSHRASCINGSPTGDILHQYCHGCLRLR